jgi:hypothetical protein
VTETGIIIYVLVGTVVAVKTMFVFIEGLGNTTISGWADVGTVIGCVLLCLVAGAIWPVVTFVHWMRTVARD